MSDYKKDKSYFYGEHAEYYGDKWAAFSKDGTEFFKKVIAEIADRLFWQIIIYINY